MPTDVPIGHYGLLSLIPAATALLVAISLRRPFAALLFGCLVGYIVLQGAGALEGDSFFDAFVGDLLAVMMDETTGWIILVCGLFGSFIALLVRSGGALAFGEAISRLARTKRDSLVVTWILGLVVFMDDYLNALVVSSSMQRVTDKFRTSREMLAYIVDSTAAPVCVLVPFSTWAIFVGRLLEDNGVADEGQGLQAFIMTIPFNLYAIIALVMVFLVAMRLLPAIGPMRAAEQRAESGGPLIPSGSEGIALLQPELDPPEYTPRRLANFVLPVLALVVATLATGVDALKGVLVALAVLFVLALPQRLMSFATFFETFFIGFKNLVFPLAIVVMSFVLVQVNTRLGLTDFVIDSLLPVMTAALLPVVVFTALSIITFSTGSFWGVYAITLPIVIPLAQQIGAPLWVSLGAVISAGAFGSHCCPFGDSTVLSSAGSGCNTMAHIWTQLPYGLIGGGIATACYLALGFLLT